MMFRIAANMPVSCATANACPRLCTHLRLPTFVKHARTNHRMHMCTQSQTRTHLSPHTDTTITHTHTHTHLQSYLQSLTHLHTDTHTHTHTHTQTRRDTHTHTHTLTHTHTHAHTRTERERERERNAAQDYHACRMPHTHDSCVPLPPYHPVPLLANTGVRADFHFHLAQHNDHVHPIGLVHRYLEFL